ncbi:transposase [Clostridium argentinense]|nr:hypothetical protein RSJ17_19000 [Clostridium argentinense]NFF37887.1 transposase [Clostridium argentinense]NFP49881.1 transposase [Clostridium argentinense]NFP71279.1 transposase [Clostridium argentinense]NFP75461.1 transposase [Clostridium argentinense]
MRWLRKLIKRNQNRLEDYDYSQEGYYFITICIENNKCILCSGEQCSPEDPNRFSLSDIGNIVDISINNISKYYPNAKIDKYIIMPNHIHIIMVLEFDNSRYTNENWRTLFAPTISRIIRHMKEYATKQIGFSIWQKSYHDHIIRNQQEYEKMWQYIDKNPLKWHEDCYYK